MKMQGGVARHNTLTIRSGSTHYMTGQSADAVISMLFISQKAVKAWIIENCLEKRILIDFHIVIC